MAQLNVELPQPAGPQGLHRHGYHLQIGLVPHRADHLHAALGDLPASALVGQAVAEHGLVVVQPLGQGLAFQLGRRHPGDGGGAVGTHDHDFPRAVNDLQHGLLGDGVAGLDEQIVIFNLRGDDLGIAPAAEQLHQGRLHLAAFQALGEQAVPGALGGIDMDIHWVFLQIL